jgi:NAD(P)-dependent dehydrogenase (short-subunit alcohol dehydrogenase family)
MTVIDSTLPTVLVTGVTGGGIGNALATALLQRGYRVFGTVLHEREAQALSLTWPQSFVPLVLDVTDHDALPSVVERVAAMVGSQGLGALINNAGIGHNGPLMHQPFSEIRQVFEVNIFGMMAVTRAFLPLLGARAHRTHPPGRIINIGSVNGAITLPFTVAYSCTKHAVEAFSQGLRRELLDYGIEVATIEPGLIRTKMVEDGARSDASQRYANEDIGPAWQQFCHQLAQVHVHAKSPEIVCKAVLHALESKRPRTRYPLDLLWRLGRWLPDRWFDQVVFKMFGYKAGAMIRK